MSYGDLQKKFICGREVVSRRRLPNRGRRLRRRLPDWAELENGWPGGDGELPRSPLIQSGIYYDRSEDARLPLYHSYHWQPEDGVPLPITHISLSYKSVAQVCSAMVTAISRRRRRGLDGRITLGVRRASYGGGVGRRRRWGGRQ